MTFEDLFEFCPTPMMVTNSEGIFIESNAKTRELAGFKSKKEAFEAHYSTQPCDISAFSEDFILQDKLVIDSAQPMQFLSMHRYADAKFHILLGTKSKTKNDLVFTNMFEITNHINPLLIELLCLHSTKSLIDKDRGFTYVFQNINKSKNFFSKQELQCLRYLSRSFSTKLIANQMALSPRTVEAYIDDLKTKLGIHSKYEIIDHCIKHKLLSFEDLFN